jgi:DNA-binding CsgD family transcriptional regulator
MPLALRTPVLVSTVPSISPGASRAITDADEVIVRRPGARNDPFRSDASVTEGKVSVTMGNIEGSERHSERREVADYLELWIDGAQERVSLDGERVTIGQSTESDLRLPFDRTVSRLHAVLERVASRWCVRDLGSRNGTFVNGERIWGERPLRSGDEIQVGRVRLVARIGDAAGEEDATIGAEGAPELTRREREVLLALCRPMVSAGVFREPASVRQIARELVVTEGAVKQHLSRLYDKFQVFEGEGRRANLANEAIRRGAVNTAAILGRPLPNSGG